MKNLLLVAHGMGRHPVRWEREVEDTLEEAAAIYGLDDRLRNEVDIVPITYDQVFDSALAELDDAAQEMSAALAIAGLADRLADLLTAITRAPDREATFWESAGDVLLYRYMANVTEQVRRTVLEQVVRALRRRGAGTQVFVLAHSLGTAVMHDSLDLLGQVRFQGDSLLARNAPGLFRGVFMLANVGAALENDRRLRNSVVRPAGAGDPAYCVDYYSFGHRNDPFLSVPFPGWPDGRYHPIETAATYAWNLHGYTHYLADPRVHVPLLNQLLAEIGEPPPIPAAARDVACSRYDAGGATPAVFQPFLDFADRMLTGLAGQPGAFHLAALAAAAAFYEREA